ncbi:hypothetical protein BKA81DRAFT_395647 [Phyllosticta paracitricarpa]|uniref:Chitin binding protein 6 n=1 Tax=Phyllosticta paracitricarpa TaxID=2016321 RepID=A0ABR1N8S8_9PEZI
MSASWATLVYLLCACLVAGQNCGPQFDGEVCDVGNCCSQYGWCDTDAAHCDPATCQTAYSGAGSSCSAKGTTPASPASSSTSSTASSTTASPSSYVSSIPVIDTCGPSEHVSCPGAGPNGYYYRCCSSAGHCGPKNSIQDPDMYCGAGCQTEYGDCSGTGGNSGNSSAPPPPDGTPGAAGEGETCGPIVNKKCAGKGLCCSGSNFCGQGTDFCGAANWCQSGWGEGKCEM